MSKMLEMRSLVKDVPNEEKLPFKESTFLKFTVISISYKGLLTDDNITTSLCKEKLH